MIRIIDTSALRIGNEVYAEENDSFGLTTLTKKHVTVSGARIRMTFPAKSGKHVDIERPGEVIRIEQGPFDLIGVRAREHGLDPRRRRGARRGEQGHIVSTSDESVTQ